MRGSPPARPHGALNAATADGSRCSGATRWILTAQSMMPSAYRLHTTRTRASSSVPGKHNHTHAQTAWSRLGHVVVRGALWRLGLHPPSCVTPSRPRPHCAPRGRTGQDWLPEEMDGRDSPKAGGTHGGAAPGRPEAWAMDTHREHRPEGASAVSGKLFSQLVRLHAPLWAGLFCLVKGQKKSPCPQAPEGSLSPAATSAAVSSWWRREGRGQRCCPDPKDRTGEAAVPPPPRGWRGVWGGRGGRAGRALRCFPRPRTEAPSPDGTAASAGGPSEPRPPPAP